MADSKVAILFNRLDSIELASCLFANRLTRWKTIHTFFTLISRLGDGVFWYCLMLVMAVLDYPHGTVVALHMAAVGFLGLVIYKLMKGRMVRQRPSITWSQIRRGTAPLDLYSFPSGHTLHAIAFSTVAIDYYPALGWLLIPFAMLIALSRVVLGLHYPSDVLVGAIIGFGLAAWSLA
jgi:undecaprenyl-diphosphatase